MAISCLAGSALIFRSRTAFLPMNLRRFGIHFRPAGISCLLRSKYLSPSGFVLKGWHKPASIWPSDLFGNRIRFRLKNGGDHPARLRPNKPPAQSILLQRPCKFLRGQIQLLYKQNLNYVVVFKVSFKVNLKKKNLTLIGIQERNFR